MASVSWALRRLSSALATDALAEATEAGEVVAASVVVVNDVVVVLVRRLLAEPLPGLPAPAGALPLPGTVVVTVVAGGSSTVWS